MAQALGKRARQALALGSDRSGEIGRQLEDDLLAAMDRPVIGAIAELAARFAEGNMDDNAIDAELRGRARRTALTLFDTVFPVIGGDTPSIKTAEVRRELVRDLYRPAPQRHAGPERLSRAIDTWHAGVMDDRATRAGLRRAQNSDEVPLATLADLATRTLGRIGDDRPALRRTKQFARVALAVGEIDHDTDHAVGRALRRTRRPLSKDRLRLLLGAPEVDP